MPLLSLLLLAAFAAAFAAATISNYI